MTENDDDNKHQFLNMCVNKFHKHIKYSNEIKCLDSINTLNIPLLYMQMMIFLYYTSCVNIRQNVTFHDFSFFDVLSLNFSASFGFVLKCYTWCKKDITRRREFVTKGWKIVLTRISITFRLRPETINLVNP